MKYKTKITVAGIFLSAILFTGCGSDDEKDETPNETLKETKSKILETYANIAIANYSDALSDAKKMQTALKNFTENPTEENFEKAKNSWLQARESYGTTEVFRLSNGPVDAEDGWVLEKYKAPEGLMNAWPLDEAGIDYTRPDDNLEAENVTGTIIGLDFKLEETEISEISHITKENLESINEAGGDANVFTGYHAIEFLLWGQDQDYAGIGTHPTAPSEGALVAGERPLSDYTADANSEARKTYLNASVELLVENLETMVDAWETNQSGNYREAFLGNGSNAIETDDALRDVIAGIGTFIKSELANERMAVAIQTPSEEDEHSCFSDNTHRDIAQNYEGFKMILFGEYKGETAVKGTGMFSFVEGDAKTEIENLISQIDSGVAHINDTAENSEHFDYQIKVDSENRQNAYNTKNRMRDLGDQMVHVAEALGISLTTQQVTDGEESEVSNF
jgi:putative iron-regulated protein